MEEKILDVFGQKITIQLKGYIVTVVKVSDEVVNIVLMTQGRCEQIRPVFTMKRFGKTADEFIMEFNGLNYRATRTLSVNVSGSPTILE